MLSEGKNNMLEEMRLQRGNAEVIYKKFTESRKFHNTHAFCIYEGEDGKYYNHRIQRYWNDNIIPFTAGNKKEVLQVMKRITSDPLYTSVCVMFFIDRDYDTSLMGTHKDLFETPCYSIENLYANEIVFQRILQAEFGLNITDSDYYKCISDYKTLLTEFNKIIVKFNAIVKFQHIFAPHIKCQFSSIKTSHIVCVQLDHIAESARFQETIDKLVTQLSAPEEDLKKLEFELIEEKKPELVFRGKNQLDFLVEIIKELKNKSKEGTYFSQRLNNIHITLTENRLSELSQYAITPPELETFLQNHLPHQNC